MTDGTAMARVRNFVHCGLECNPEYDDPELLEDDKERFDELLLDAVAEATDPLRAALLRIVEARYKVSGLHYHSRAAVKLSEAIEAAKPLVKP